MKKNYIVCDIETNNLLYKGTTIWCIVCKELENNKWFYYSHGSGLHRNFLAKKIFYKFSFLEDLLRTMESYDSIIFHNGIMFDVPFIQKLYSFNPKDVEDTFILSSLFEPDREGGHALENYGKQFGLYKKEHEDWSQFSYEMLERCFRDVEITELTWKYLSKERKSWNWEQSIRLEYTCARLCSQMEMNGVRLDIKYAEEILERINKELEEIDKKLLELIPKQVVALYNKKAVTKPFKMNGEYSKQVTDYFGDILL